MCLHHMSLRVLSALSGSIAILHRLLVVQTGLSARPAMPKTAWLLLAKVRGTCHNDQQVWT